MAIMVLLEAEAKAEAVGPLKAALASAFPDTRAYEGCRGITAYTSTDDGQSIVFVEFWESKAHYERYLAWRTETGVMAQLASMLEGDLRIRCFEQVDA